MCQLVLARRGKWLFHIGVSINFLSSGSSRTAQHGWCTWLQSDHSFSIPNFKVFGSGSAASNDSNWQMTKRRLSSIAIKPSLLFTFTLPFVALLRRGPPISLAIPFLSRCRISSWKAACWRGVYLWGRIHLQTQDPSIVFYGWGRIHLQTQDSSRVFHGWDTSDPIRMPVHNKITGRRDLNLSCTRCLGPGSIPVIVVTRKPLFSNLVRRLGTDGWWLSDSIVLLR